MAVIALVGGMSLSAPSVAVAEGASPSTERIALWPDGRAPIGGGQFEARNAYVTIYRPEKPNGAVVVICPGGGYGMLAVEPEGFGIARWLNRHGITGIVLEYRLPNGNRFVPLLDAQRAIRMARFKAKEWECDANRIGIMGFSAGGHLASTAETRYDSGDPAAPDPIDTMGCRPDFGILVYPVITMGPLGHAWTRGNLLGPNPSPDLVKLYSNEQQVTDQTPPTFLAHAQDDTAVSPENSQMFYDALQAHHVPSVYLKLPSGGHGLDGYKGPMWDAWQTESLKWLAKLKIIPGEGV